MSPLFSNFGYDVQFTGFLVLYIVEPPIKFVPNCISTELVRHTKTKPCNTTWAELIAILTVCDLSSVFIVSLSTIHDLFGHEALSTLKVSSEIRPCLMFVTSESHHDQCPNYWRRKKRGQFGKYQTINLIIICKWIVFFMWKIICDIIILVYVYTFGNYKFWWRSRESSEVTDEVVTLLCPTLCGSCT